MSASPPLRTLLSFVGPVAHVPPGSLAPAITRDKHLARMRDPKTPVAERVAHWGAELAAIIAREAGPDSGSVCLRNAGNLGNVEAGRRDQFVAQYRLAGEALDRLVDAITNGGLDAHLDGMPDPDVGHRPLVLKLLTQAVRLWTSSARDERTHDPALRASLKEVIETPEAGSAVKKVIEHILSDIPAADSRRRNRAGEHDSGKEQDGPKGRKPPKNTMQNIIVAIKNKKKPLDAGGIRQALGWKRQASLRHYLAWMMRNGHLARPEGAGGYWLPGEPLPKL